MTRALQAVRIMKAAMAHIRKGRGVAASLVVCFRGTDYGEVARSLLLGRGPREALTRLKEEGREVSILASLVSGSVYSSTSAICAKGEVLSELIEGWLTKAEWRRAELAVLRARGLMLSAITGAVCSMISTLGPVLGSFGLSNSAIHTTQYLDYAGLALSAVSSAMMGIYVWPKRFYLYAVLSSCAFAVVAIAVAPLASISSSGIGQVLGR